MFNEESVSWAAGSVTCAPMPRISVLLPVRNAAPYLGASLASLWRQTFADFEVVAVDDGSTDGSGEILDRAAAREPRLRVVHARHRGLPATLNAAWAAARSPLLARHDADDVAHRRRFELQAAYLRDHPRVAVVGCRVRLFPAAAVGAGMRRWVLWHNRLLTHEEMAREVLIDSPLVHGTALIRRKWIEGAGGWTEEPWAEDLDLWIRLLEAGARFGKRPETLYGWRQHSASATRTDSRYSPDRFMSLKLAALRRGVLRDRTRVTLIGVGVSLARWSVALGADFDVEPVEARRPSTALLNRIAAPLVLVYGAAPARERWRDALRRTAFREGDSFIFVA